MKSERERAMTKKKKKKINRSATAQIIHRMILYFSFIRELADIDGRLLMRDISQRRKKKS